MRLQQRGKKNHMNKDMEIRMKLACVEIYDKWEHGGFAWERLYGERGNGKKNYEEVRMSSIRVGTRFM